MLATFRGVGDFSSWDRVGWVEGALFTLHCLVLAYSGLSYKETFLNPVYSYLLVSVVSLSYSAKKGSFYDLSTHSSFRVVGPS